MFGTFVQLFFLVGDGEQNNNRKRSFKCKKHFKNSITYRTSKTETFLARCIFCPD